MTEDHRLMMDEARRLAQYETLKDEMRNSVQAEIVREGTQPTAQDQARMAAAGDALRQQALDETVNTENELARGRFAARLSQFIDFAFYLIYGLIALEIILDLAGANRRNAFRQMVESLSTPLLWPFEKLLSDPGVGRFQFRLSYLIGLLVYLLLHVAITVMLRLIAQRKTII